MSSAVQAQGGMQSSPELDSCLGWLRSCSTISAAGGNYRPERQMHNLNETDAGCEGNQTAQGNRHKQYYQNSEESLFIFFIMIANVVIFVIQDTYTHKRLWLFKKV